jgi:hypothetical protein
MRSYSTYVKQAEESILNARNSNLTGQYRDLSILSLYNLARESSYSSVALSLLELEGCDVNLFTAS